MSTRLNAHLIPHDRAWDFQKSARAWGISASPLARIAANVTRDEALAFVDARLSADPDTKAAATATVEQMGEMSVELQLFEFPDGILIRPLSAPGSGVERWLDDLPYTVKVSYNDSTDVPDEDLPNKAIARTLDQLIARKQYVVVSTYSVDEYLHAVHQIAYRLSGRDKPAEHLVVCPDCGGRGYDLKSDDYDDCVGCQGKGLDRAGFLPEFS